MVIKELVTGNRKKEKREAMSKKRQEQEKRRVLGVARNETAISNQ